MIESENILRSEVISPHSLTLRCSRGGYINGPTVCAEHYTLR